MKILGLVITIISLFLFNSCKSNSSPTDSGGIGGPGGGGGSSVTFSITQGPGNNGGIIMYATPSVAVFITNVNVSVANVNPPFNKDYPGDGTTVYPASQPAAINEFTGVASGQKWVFVFTGNLGSKTGTAFSATSNYTVP